jgi:hypothetical protein
MTREQRITKVFENKLGRTAPFLKITVFIIVFGPCATSHVQVTGGKKQSNSF